jgi:hypothetical protein
MMPASRISPSKRIVARCCPPASRIRPVEDDERLAAMITGPGLMMTARRGGRDAELAGLARCLTDHRWICYLSDRAVGEHAQGLGIGQRVVAAIRRELGPGVGIVLVSVPDAEAFCERIGMIRITNTFKIDRDG